MSAVSGTIQDAMELGQLLLALRAQAAPQITLEERISRLADTQETSQYLL